MKKKVVWFKSGSGRPGLPVTNSPCGLCVLGKATFQEEGGLVQYIRSCVKVEVAVLGSPSLIVRTVSVDVSNI